MRTIDLYIGDMFYGSIRMKFNGYPFTTKEEEIADEIERRLPYLKHKKFTIKIN